VFYLGDFNDPETYRAGSTFRPRLEGIIIEKPSEVPVLVGVRIGTIIGAPPTGGLTSGGLWGRWLLIEDTCAVLLNGVVPSNSFWRRDASRSKPSTS
jgi:hypothetical protein